MAQIDLNAAEDYDLENPPKRISLDEFYESLTHFTLTDEEALEYMKFSAKMARVSFRSDNEMLSFKADFTAALAFIGQLDEVDVKGVEPLGNVFEFYGGNEENLRTKEDFAHSEATGLNKNKKQAFIKMNKHAQKDGNYSVLPLCSTPNPDGE
jgi:aspartyl/glutamyl-tRNA(Asn/Gln) amidotransferase C subunit